MIRNRNRRISQMLVRSGLGLFLSILFVPPIFGQSGVITTVAGTSTPGDGGDGGPATAAQLNKPRGIAFDAADNLFIADSGNNRIRRVTPEGIITTVKAGVNVSGAQQIETFVNGPIDIMVDGA